MNVLKEHTREIFHAAVDACDPGELVRRALSLRGDKLEIAGKMYALGTEGRLFVIGAGKASPRMAAAVESLVGERITSGIVVAKRGEPPAGKLGTSSATGVGRECLPRKIEVIEASHPVPDAAGVRAGRRILDLARSARDGDLILCLISGGGSALLVSPQPPVTLEEKRKVTGLLLKSGAPIQVLNTVRKHLSMIKGGKLARAAFPARILTLAISDVVGDSPDVIASGPTAPDPTTYGDARGCLVNLGLWGRCPPGVRELLLRGEEGDVEETPKPQDPCFDRSEIHVIGRNEVGLAAAEKKAAELSYRPLVLSSRLVGEAREVAKVLVAVAREVRANGRPVSPPACLLWGGETTVTVRGAGQGGRNQEMALAAALQLSGDRGIAFLSASSDGEDGPTPAAGAVADGDTVRRAAELGLDPARYLAANDSHRFFAVLEDLVSTGSTGTNVMDFQVILVKT